MQTHESILSRLGAALRWLRDRQGRKQYQVADSAGITKGMLSAYETGRQRPSLETLEKILQTLGCDLNDLHYALRVVNGDLEAPSATPGRFSGEPRRPWEGFSGPTSQNDAALLAEILGGHRPLDPEEEAALLQMVKGFHRLLRFFHHSLEGHAGGAPRAAEEP
jgi:transcriptional regulator with XRE-family HTH domain